MTNVLNLRNKYNMLRAHLPTTSLILALCVGCVPVSKPITLDRHTTSSDQCGKGPFKSDESKALAWLEAQQLLYYGSNVLCANDPLATQRRGELVKAFGQYATKMLGDETDAARTETEFLIKMASQYNLTTRYQPTDHFFVASLVEVSYRGGQGGDLEYSTTNAVLSFAVEAGRIYEVRAERVKQQGWAELKHDLFGGTRHVGRMGYGQRIRSDCRRQTAQLTNMRPEQKVGDAYGANTRVELTGVNVVLARERSSRRLTRKSFGCIPGRGQAPRSGVTPQPVPGVSCWRAHASVITKDDDS